MSEVQRILPRKYFREVFLEKLIIQNLIIQKLIIQKLIIQKLTLNLFHFLDALWPAEAETGAWHISEVVPPQVVGHGIFLSRFRNIFSPDGTSAPAQIKIKMKMKNEKSNGLPENFSSRTYHPETYF